MNVKLETVQWDDGVIPIKSADSTKEEPFFKTDSEAMKSFQN